MSALWLALALLLGTTPEDVPVGESAVIDLTHTLRDRDRVALDERVRTLHAEHHVQLAVVVVDTVYPLGIEDWGVRVFARWGLGDAANDNGVLLVLAMNDRLSRLEVGYGLEPYIPDEDAQLMLDGMRNELRSGDVAGAIDGLVTRVASATADYVPGAPAPKPPLGKSGLAPFFVMLFGTFIGVLVMLGRGALGRRAAALYEAQQQVHESIARALRTRRWRAWLFVLAAIPTFVLMLGVFHRGIDFGWAMGLGACLFMLVGMTLVVSAQHSIAAIVVHAMVLFFIALFALPGLVDKSWTSGGDALEPMLISGGAIVFGWGFCAFVLLMPSGSGASGSGSYSGSSYSGDSSSSYGSSSSYDSGSSSSSSSDYSGGGGSSGGGGATSSW